jgi:hypothetical protein
MPGRGCFRRIKEECHVGRDDGLQGSPRLIIVNHGVARRLNQIRSADRVGCAPPASVCLGENRIRLGHGKDMHEAIRMFVRFLIADGRCAVGFDAAIPIVAHWRVAVLPRYLKPDEMRGQSALPSRTLGSAG